MLNNNELSMDVSGSCNEKIMRIYDTSFYCTTEELPENYLIEVLPVNKSTWILFHVSRDFSLVLNSSNLHYKKVTEASSLIDLPDGIYEFKQSIKPNIHTLVQFYHLRTTSLLNKLRHSWNRLISGKCDISRIDFLANRDRLREIDEYLLAAKYEVEECLDKKKGKELYDFAKKLLEQYTNKCKC